MTTDEAVTSTKADETSIAKAAETSEPVAGPSRETLPMEGRKPTRPLRPGQRKMRLRGLPSHYPSTGSTKGKALMPKSKRKIDLAPSTLAKHLAKIADKSSAEVVKELTSIYQWTPEERRSKRNVVRGMQAAQ